MKTQTYLFLLLLFPFLAIAQPEAYNWYFGNRFGLNFSSGTPVELTDGALQTFEGCAAISDSEGNLLFYTNGGGRDPSTGQPAGAIWNRDHEVMYDMSFTEGGGWSSAQSSLIIPKPGQDSVYYLFTMEEVEFVLGGAPPGQPQGRGLSYFEVDMRLNDGLGGVTLADQRLFVPSFEGLSGTIHADGERYWILITDGEEESNTFIRLLVDDTPIETADLEFIPVDSTEFIGGAIKMSPDGRWIASNGQLFSFDNETGDIPFSPVINLLGFRSGTFSPESRYYYFWQSSTQLARIDLLADDIEASLEIVFTDSIERNPGQLQIGPNGNIYFVTVNFFDMTTNIGEIICPDTPAPTVSSELFEYMGTELGPFFFGLPNFTDHIFSSALANDLATAEELVICSGESLTLEARRLGQSYLWSTGDTGVNIEINEPGTYTVTIADGCGGTVVDEKIVTGGSAPTIAFDELPLDSLCLDETYELTVITELGNIIEWSTGETSSTIFIEDSTALSVTVSNACGSLTEELNPRFVDCTTEDCDLIFPDIISPNGDGVNDIFTGYRNCAPTSYELRVYNRWGNLVFESDDVENAWDGRFNDSPAPSDVYIYQAQYRFVDTEEFQTVRGQLTIVR